MQKVQKLIAEWKLQQREREQQQAKEHEMKIQFLENNKEPEPRKCEHGNIVSKPWAAISRDGFYWSWESVKCNICFSDSQKTSRKEAVDSILRIPKRYHSTPLVSSNFDKFNSRQGIVFSGSVGTGKTYEAVTLAKQLYIEQDIRGIFTTGVDVAMELKSSIGNKNYEEVINSYKQCDLLFIDDLGVESATEFMLESLYNILNYRYNHMLPILFTTNLNAKEFADIYGQRLLSRIIEMAEFVKLEGKDKRLKK